MLGTANPKQIEKLVKEHKCLDYVNQILERSSQKRLALGNLLKILKLEKTSEGEKYINFFGKELINKIKELSQNESKCADLIKEILTYFEPLIP